MNRSGTTLVEVIVAMALAGIAVMSVASLTIAATRTLARARALDEAYELLQSFVDSARMSTGPDAGARAHPLGTLSWELAASPGESWARFDHIALDDSVVVHFAVASTLAPRATDR